MSEINESANLQGGGSPSGEGDSASDDADLLAALETLRRVVSRPKRAPRGTNDVWGWSTDQEHALEPGTEPREQVVARIKKSLEPEDGLPAPTREAGEAAVLETIAHVIDAMKDRPEYAQHDLKRIVKALEAVVSDKVGPGDAPPEPSKMLIGPGIKSSRQIAEELAQPVLTPEEETLDYAYIVSDHPTIAELVREHGLTTVWNELLRLRFDLPSKNEEIASTLCKVTLALHGDYLFPNVPNRPAPKMYVDEKGAPVMYNQSRSTDIFPLELFWADSQIQEKRDVLKALEPRMDRSGRRADYSMVEGLGGTVPILASLVGKRALWIELMRLRYGAGPKDQKLRDDLKEIAEDDPSLLEIPPGEEGVPPRLIAELRNEVASIMRRAMELREHNMKAREHRYRLESGENGRYIRLAPWNTYVPLPPKPGPAPDGADPGAGNQPEGVKGVETTQKGDGGPSDQTMHALETLDSIGRIAEEGLPAPAAGILADALRLAANQIEQQTGIAEASSTSSASAKANTPQKIEKTYKEGFKIIYTEGQRASLIFSPLPERVYYRELLTYFERENYNKHKRNHSEGRDFNHLFTEGYKDGYKKEVWGGKSSPVAHLDRRLLWDQLHPDGLDVSNPYYPFPKEYIEYALGVREAYDETYKKFEETQRISVQGPVARLKQVWKDHADGIHNRLWSPWQLYYCKTVFAATLEYSEYTRKTGMKGGQVADWQALHSFRDLQLPKSRSYFEPLIVNDKG